MSYNYNYAKMEYLIYFQLGGVKNKWKTFSHNGVLFPPEYTKHDIPIICNGERIILSKDAEELATLYAKYTESEYIKSAVFKKNFWKDWKKTLTNFPQIKSLADCDFSLIFSYLIDQKEKVKGISKQEKILIKEEKDTIEHKYKTAIVDGKEQPVGNFRVEPPGIFIGRGCHPKLGRIKRRIYPEDITINIGKEADIPKIPDIFNKKHNWGKIIHDRTVEWLASWVDNVTNKTKYVWLGTQSNFKADSDIRKFDLARKLKKKIARIRETNYKNMSDGDIIVRQIATALYLVDYLALRVGNEKSEDEADTVGVTSLRVEHIRLEEDDKITLDFLGKDSVRYLRTIVVDPQVYKNIGDFMEDKRSDEDIFNKINSSMLNKYLQSFMPELTAKVFRTYNASCLFQKELKKISKKVQTMNDLDESSKINFLLDGFNKANIRVALLCNHQKQVSKTFDEQLAKINTKIKEAQKQLKKIKKDSKNKERIKKKKDSINKMKAKRDLKIDLKNISLETSKVNYIDPRITISFIKKHNISIDKIFSKNLQNKFWWAFEVEDYKF